MRRLIQNCAVIAALSTSSIALAQDANGSVDLNPRPTGNTFGIGLGWQTPISILQPNTVSARVRLGKVTLEPSFILGGSSQSTTSDTSSTIGTLPPTESSTDGSVGGFNAGVGAQVRYPVVSKGPLDFLAIGNVGVSWGSSNEEKNGPADGQIETTSRQSLGANLGYGLGIEWFLGHGLSLSADATNPLIAYSNSNVVTETRADFGGSPAVSRNETGGSGFNWGLVFQPQVRIMMHLYF
ncbi:MAG: hypothetical protein WBV82_28125 [Myxococcaceae bacterium]